MEPVDESSLENELPVENTLADLSQVVAPVLRSGVAVHDENDDLDEVGIFLEAMAEHTSASPSGSPAPLDLEVDGIEEVTIEEVSMLDSIEADGGVGYFEDAAHMEFAQELSAAEEEML